MAYYVTVERFLLWMMIQLVIKFQDLNFDLLSKAARYQNGYNAKSATIEVWKFYFSVLMKDSTF